MQESVVRGASGEYRIYAEIGVGGMARVHLARFLGKAGFARTVAIKRPLPALQQSEDFRRLATREALLAARVQHPHVVATLDVIDSGNEFLIVMQYVHGEPLSELIALARQRGERVPLDIAVTLLGGVLRGLSAVHQAVDERGKVLGLIHRDVSPQNILCGVDGVARLSDFGLAKAAGYMALSNAAEFKGKLTYASPEQVELSPLTLATDLYAAGVVLWELASGERMYRDRTASELVAQLLRGDVAPPSRFVPSLPPALDPVVLRALAREPERRYESALAMAAALEACVRPASIEATSEWITALASESLQARNQLVLEAESETAPSQRRPASPMTGPWDPTVRAGDTREERDSAPRGASTGAGLFGKTTLRVFAMAAGVAFVWVLGEGLWPRAAQPPPLAVGAGALAAGTGPLAPVPSHPLRERADGGGAAPERAVDTATARPAGSAAVDSVQEALRPKVVKTPAAPASRGSSAPPAADCSPPFSLDAEGIRHMKPGCQ